MRTPGTPGTGITGAKAGKSLGSDDQLLSHAGSEIQCRYRLALYLDREADALLFLGRHAAAERLSHQALALRAALQLHLVPFVIGRDGDRTTVIAKCRAWVCDQPELMAGALMSALVRPMIGARPAGRRHTDDFHETPRVAVEALLSVESFTGPIWEPACGLGAISEVLIEHGRDVISTDLVDRGYGLGRIDFLMELEPRAPNIITNPPFKLAAEFAQNALRLTTGKVALLVRWQWLASARRRSFFENSPLARTWLFSRRLPLMHRHGYAGPRASSAIDHCWCVWEHGHLGPAHHGWLP